MASLENRGNGSWRVIVSNGYDPDGKKNRLQRIIKVDPNKTENAQRQEVKKQAAIIEADFRRHLITDSKKVKLYAVCDEYLEDHPMAESTKAWYRGLFTRIKPALGNVPVQDLTPQMIRGFYKKLTKEAAKPATTKKASKKNLSKDTDKKDEKKAAPKTRSKDGKLSGTYRLHYHRALSAVLGFAVKSGYISVNPIQAVDAPAADTPEAKFFKEDDIAQLMEVLENLDDPMWKAFFILAIYSSCRPGELIGLNWSDLEEQYLTINAGSYRENGKTIRTSKPKNKSSKRVIVLADEALAPLKEWRKIQRKYRMKFGGEWPKESIDAIFTGAEGYRIDISSPTQKWRKIQQKYNLADINLYGFRHTGASLMIDSGIDVKKVAGRLGHSRASTTLDKYSHLFERAAQQTTDAISAAIKKARMEPKQEEPEEEDDTPMEEAK